MKALAALLLLWPGGAAAACRLALVLALDISGSVDALEYRQQIDGVTAALNDTAVRQALFAMPGAPVDLAVFEWSAPEAQRILLPWTTLATPGALDAVLATLAGVRRQPAPPVTALGAAMQRGAALLAQRPACWRRVLDVSGDGASNAGPRPKDVRRTAAFTGVTVNGLVIGHPPGAGPAFAAETRSLTTYFEAQVLHGPEAFLELAEGYGDYARALRRKLLREMQSYALSDARAP